MCRNVAVWSAEELDSNRVAYFFQICKGTVFFRAPRELIPLKGNVTCIVVSNRSTNRKGYQLTCGFLPSTIALIWDWNKFEQALINSRGSCFARPAILNKFSG
ncbi:hypothetical protein H106_02675 [Trichophyton rubrum CBS 735.88]|nr:hypothetical protein H106_02675 [Trichophyton rubrum CBS 735.88]